MNQQAPDVPVPARPSLAEARALLARSRLLGRVSAFIFLLAALAVVDALQTLVRHEFNTIDLVPGETVLVSGMLPAGISKYEDLVIEIQGDPNISFTPLETYKGFWMGGHMWRAELSAAKDALPGQAVVTVVDIIAPETDSKNFDDRDRAILFGGQQNPALVFGITVWPSESARQAGDISVFRRITGFPAFGVAAFAVFVALLAGLANWRFFCKAETALAAHGVFFIHGLKEVRDEASGANPASSLRAPLDGYKAAFARAGHSFVRAEPVLLYDRNWKEQGRGSIVGIDKYKAFALFPLDGIRPRYGWLVLREMVKQENDGG